MAWEMRRSRQGVPDSRFYAPGCRLSPSCLRKPLTPLLRLRHRETGSRARRPRTVPLSLSLRLPLLQAPLGCLKLLPAPPTDVPGSRKSPTPLLRLRHRETGSRAHRPRPSASDYSTRPLLPPPLLAPVGLRRPPSLAPVSAAGSRRPRKASVFCSHWPQKASIPSSQALPRPPQAAPELLQKLPSSPSAASSCFQAPSPFLSPFPSLSLPHLGTRAELPSPILRPRWLAPRVRGSRGCVHGSQPCTSLASSLSARLQTSALAPFSLSSPRPRTAPISSSCRLPSASAPFSLSSPQPAPLGLVQLPSPAPANSPRPQLP